MSSAVSVHTDSGGAVVLSCLSRSGGEEQGATVRDAASNLGAGGDEGAAQHGGSVALEGAQAGAIGQPPQPHRLVAARRRHRLQPQYSRQASPTGPKQTACLLQRCCYCCGIG